MPQPLSVPQIHPVVLRGLSATSFGLLVLATVLFFRGAPGGDADAADLLLMAWLLAATGALLLAGEQRDERARWFGRFLVFNATAFCFVVLNEHAKSAAHLIEALPAHVAIMAVAPYCLWRLAAEFPRAVDSAAMRRLLQTGTVAAWLFCWLGLIGNLGVWLGVEPANSLDHGPDGGAFQILWMALNTAALLAIAFRWLRASQRDRRRAFPFLAALGVLGFMLAAVVAGSLANTPLSTTRAVFAAALVALLPCLVGAIRQRGLHVRMLGAGPLLRNGVEILTWTVLATPVLLFWLRWSTTEPRPSLELRLLFFGCLVAVAIGSRLSGRGPTAPSEDERTTLIHDAPRLASTLQSDQWLGTVMRWCGAETARLYAIHPENTGPLLVPLPEPGQGLVSYFYLERTTLDIDHLDPLEFERIDASARRWIAEQGIALVEPILSARDHLLGLLVIGRPATENTHRPETVALLPVLAASLAPALERSRPNAEPSAISGGDPVLAAALCPDCQTVFSTLVDECHDCRQELASLDQPLLVRDSYQLEKRLGRGSWGSVFRARDLVLERPVALKFFHLGGDSGAAALLREARALVTLRGHRLAEIYAAEHSDEGLVLVTEFLEGGVLADRMQRGVPTMAWRDAFELGLDVLACLEPLHDRDLLHGDIKPSNLGFDSDGQLKLIDFGMVQALRDGSLPSTPSSGGLSDSTLLPGGQPGTPIYSPPEAWEGQLVGIAGDLWPVAVLLWELVAGDHPFVCDNDDFDQLGHRIRRGQTRPWPPTVACPPRVRSFFERALHVDPGKRYVDLPAMERALRSILATTRSRG